MSLDSDVIIDDPRKELFEPSINKQHGGRIRCYTSITGKMMKEAHIIFGASGLPSLKKDHIIKYFEICRNDGNACEHELNLVSVSSKQIEFIDAINFLERCIADGDTADSLGFSTITKHKVKDFGTEYAITFNEDQVIKIIFLANGYPVTFFPEYTDAAPNRPMDPIMTELFLAACLLQANHQNLSNKIYEVPDLSRIELVVIS